MKATLLSLVIVLSLSSCMHQYYVPNSQNIPLFKKKNEGRLLIGTNLFGVGTTGGSAGFNDPQAKSKTIYLQSAASFSGQMSGMLNFSHVSGHGPNGSGKGSVVEGALGYYKCLDEHLLFELFGGAGYSWQTHNYKRDFYGNSTLKFHQEFLQPSIALTFKRFEFALSSKFSSRTFSKIQFSSDSLPYELDIMSSNPTNLLFEPAATMRFGGENVKVQLQYVLLRSFTKVPFNEERAILSLSFHIALRNTESVK